MILFGPAGNCAGDILSSLKRLKEIGLGTMEVEFVRGVRMSNDTAKKVGILARNLKIPLSIHAPYYINLNSVEKEKIEASKKRILRSCERGQFFGKCYVVFHAAYYGKSSKEETYYAVKQAVIEMQKVIKKKKWNVILAPEATGKKSQFGDLDELLRLRKETKCELCVDFAHLRARNNGRIDYKDVFDKLKGVKHIHAHFSGIEFTEKGERRHLLTEKKDIKLLLTHVKKRKLKSITFINESPNPPGDALKMKEYFEKI